MKALALEPRTMIFYESPYRLVKTLAQFIEYFGVNRKASVSRELTKKFEETVNGTLSELHAHFSSKDVKGEIVMVVAGDDARKRAAAQQRGGICAAIRQVHRRPHGSGPPRLRHRNVGLLMRCLVTVC